MENMPEYIEAALDMGFDVEVDVWVFKDHSFYLGHKHPLYRVKKEFFYKPGIWAHAKNLYALLAMREIGVDCFYIEGLQDATLTSNGFIWTSPQGHFSAWKDNIITPLSIAVMPEYSTWSDRDIKDAAGICSNDLTKWRDYA
jgi:hypothetical protein